MISTKSKFTIKQIFKDNWSEFLETGTPIRPVVLHEVQKIMNCREPSLGYSLYFCEHCNKFKYVYFTCKSRFCNSCGMKYQEDRALNISSKLINCTHRHIVFTIPEELRVFFRKDRSLLNVLFTAASQTILSWFHNLNKSEAFKPGIISVLHTFGRDLKWNPHIHMLVTEGASGNSSVWRVVKHIPFVMLRKKWQTSLLFLLEQSLGKDAFRKIKNRLYASNKDGFYVHAKSNFDSKYDVVNYIIRYTGRPVMAQSRILNYDGNTVSFWYQRHEDNQKVTETIPVFDFIKRLIVHIPESQFKMIRYYGLYAKKYKFHSLIRKKTKDSYLKIKRLLSHWRERILTSFKYDPLKCSCGNFMIFVEFFVPSSVANSPP